MMKSRGLLIVTAFFASFLLFGQSSDGDAITVEELYLQSIEMQIIRHQATHESREQKLLALRSVEEMLEDGKVAEGDRDTTVILNYLATEGTSRTVRENGRLVNNYPEVRRQACELLGEVGGEESSKSLIQILKQENEPMVQAEAIYALGKIGDNTDNKASTAIVNTIAVQDPVIPDDNLAYSCLLAIEKIAESNNGIADDDLFQAIMKIAMGNYIREVKNKANELLETLKKYE